MLRKYQVMRRVLFEAEDIIDDSVITQTAEKKAKNPSARMFHGPRKLLRDPRARMFHGPRKLLRVAEQAEKAKNPSAWMFHGPIKLLSVAEQAENVLRIAEPAEKLLQLLRAAEQSEKLLRAGEHLEEILRSAELFAKLFRAAVQVEAMPTRDEESNLYTVSGKHSDFFPQVPWEGEHNVVGFEDEAQTLINYLKEETEKLDVISIIGMPGSGKSTLAAKIFCDPYIRNEFPVRLWVYVSQNLRTRDVFLTILSNFINVEDEEIKSKTNDKLAQMVREHLESTKILIVLDDIWSSEGWINLRVAFPRSYRQGKILITSRNEEVARLANRNRDPHRLRLLTHEESWQLLQLRVFSKPECPPDLEELGKNIADQCQGLPLPIVVIGGILADKASTRDMKAMKNMWRKVSENLTMYLNDGEKGMRSIIALSYDGLPNYLRRCFLYLGMFPVDFEISVWELINMWIAEGFIQPKSGTSLEETAQHYLEELVNRNLVIVDKLSLDGKIKTCRIHDMLPDFCRNEAGSENFFHEIKKLEGGDFAPSITEIKKYRRLCIHSNVLSFISSEPFVPQIRSFLCYSREQITLPPDEETSFIAAFKLLRVLAVQPISFTTIPDDFKLLVHLRYITVSCHSKVLPRAFSELWNLQTLIVYTRFLTLEIEADIWNLTHLRHVKTNAITTLPKPGRSSKKCRKLQTLGTISPESCTEDVFNKVRSLRKLGIRGQLVTLLDAKGLEKLDHLEKLKLVNDAYRRPPYECPLPGLPKPCKFPPKLRSLTISHTLLDWSHMSTLAMLDTLQVLKLKDRAFMGNRWEATYEGFRHLEVLYIGYTNLVIWKATANHFPRLRCLVLRNCGKLEEIPSSLGENLQRLDLKGVRQSAAASARKIEQAKRQQQGKETSRSSGFKLFIS